jgi:CRISPR-associated protein Cas1
MADRTDTEKSPSALGDDTEWADRCEYWADHRPTVRGPHKKYNYRQPLILCGHGIRINVHRNTLLIRPGLTHYPQQRAELRYFPGDPNLPDRIIILDASGGITFDALAWMSDQKITLVQLNWRGQVTFSGNSGFAAAPQLVQLQSQLWGSKKALLLNRDLITAKLDASIQTLLRIFPDLPATEIAVSRIKQGLLKLKKLPATAPQRTLLGLEGAAAAEYFRAWHRTPLNWNNLSRKPVPPNWLEIGPRQMAWLKSGSNARHPINAMLNYGYAMLISQVHKTIVAAGLDPTIGIAHRRHTNPIPLVYDLMEPLRPVVDRKVLEFALSSTFTPGDFSITQIGGCRLNPQLAKSVAKHVAGLQCRDGIEDFLNRLV